MTPEAEARADLPRELAHTDRRVLRSRQLIVEAFERLLLQMPLDKITVSAIAREAGVDRKTFYQHFGTVDGLLDGIAEELVRTILDDMEREYERLGGSGSDQEISAFFSSASRAVCQNLELNRRYFECISTEQLLAHFQEPFLRGILERRPLMRELPDRQLACAVSFYLGGLLSVSRAWLLGESDLSMEETTRIVNELMLHGLERYGEA